MSLLAIVLVTVSAFTHALWNFVSKRSHPQASFFLMASLASALLLSPLLVLLRAALPAIPAAVWRLIAATGAVQAVYYIFLAATYRAGDLSHAYPLARSLPVVFVAGISLALGRGDQIHPAAFVGFAAVTVGCLLLPLPGFGSLAPRHYARRWVFFAFAAALCTAGYTLLDDQALRLLRSQPGPLLGNLGWALLFGELEGLSISFFLGLLLLSWGPERRSLLRATRQEWGRSALLGCVITLTYGLVLLAMAYVPNVSYISAFRQLSIPIGAVLGMLYLKEPAYPPKLVGIGLVMAGLLMVALS